MVFMVGISINISLIGIFALVVLIVFAVRLGRKMYSDCKEDFKVEDIDKFVKNVGTHEEYMRLYNVYKKCILKLLKKLQCVKITK